MFRRNLVLTLLPWGWRLQAPQNAVYQTTRRSISEEASNLHENSSIPCGWSDSNIAYLADTKPRCTDSANMPLISLYILLSKACKNGAANNKSESFSHVIIEATPKKLATAT
jgi:hypothetical protein